MREVLRIDESVVELRPGARPNEEILNHIKGRYRLVELYIFNDIERMVMDARVNYLGMKTTLRELYDIIVMSIKAGRRLYVAYVSQLPYSHIHAVGVDMFRKGGEEIYKHVEEKILTYCQTPIVLSNTPYQIPVKYLILKPVYAYEVVVCSDKAVVGLAKRRRFNLAVYGKRRIG